MLFAEQEVKKALPQVVLCRSVTADGWPFYLFIEATKDAVERMRRDYRRCVSVDFSAYGRILFRGFGKEPAPELRQRFMLKK